MTSRLINKVNSLMSNSGNSEFDWYHCFVYHCYHVVLEPKNSVVYICYKRKEPEVLNMSSLD